MTRPSTVSSPSSARSSPASRVRSGVLAEPLGARGGGPLAGVDLERDAVEGADLAVALRDFAQLHQRFAAVSLDGSVHVVLRLFCPFRLFGLLRRFRFFGLLRRFPNRVVHEYSHHSPRSAA